MATPARQDDGRYIVEIDLVTTPAQCAELAKRFEAARQAYNAALGEALRRLNHVRRVLAAELPEPAAFLALPKKEKRAVASEDVPDLRPYYRRLREELRAVGLNKKYALQDWAKHANRPGSPISRHIDANTVLAMCGRAVRAVKEHAFGVAAAGGGRASRGRPRFASYRHPLTSIEGRSNRGGLRRVDDVILFGGAHAHRLTLPLKVRDDHQRAALEHETALVRLVRRSVRGQDRYSAQLVQKGRTPRRREIGSGIVAVDVGPSCVAVYSVDGVMLRPLSPAVDERWIEHERRLRRLMRKLDRQRRANNPGNYDAKGRVVRGPKTWVRSKKQLVTLGQVRDAQRRLAALRRQMHGALIAEILALGNVIHLEQNWRSNWQRDRRMSKSVTKHAPGTFVALLQQVAAVEGATVRVLNSVALRLAHRCHCGRREDKPLSLRWHRCDAFEHGDGIEIQRNLYCAFLAFHCGDDDELDEVGAAGTWYHAHPRLTLAQETCRLTDWHLADGFGMRSGR